MENLKHSKSQFFWDQLRKFNSQFSALLGTVKIEPSHTMYSRNTEKLRVILHGLVEDLKIRLPKDSFCLRLFYDLDNNCSPLIHYLFLVDRKKVEEFQKSQLYEASEVKLIDDRLTNYKRKVDHYFEYHDLFGYERVERIFC